MAGEWVVTDFADVIDFQEGPGILAKDFHDHGIPLIRLSGLDRGASLLTGCNYLDPALVAKKWAHFALQKGDILLSTSASLGRIAVVDDEGVGAIAYTGIIRMRPRDDRLIAPFIRYLLEGPYFQQQAEAFGAGSVIRHFGPMHLRQMTVLLPPLPEQRAIAHILGTLDDKIELNRRMSETLEAMARALFKSWFVDFDPVRAKIEGRWRRGESLPLPAPQSEAARQAGGLPAHLYDLFPDRLVESELGEIPEGWGVGCVAELADVTSGKRPTVRFSDPSYDAYVPLWGGNGPMGYVAEALFSEPILLTGRVGTLGSVFRITQPSWPSDNTLVLRPRRRRDFEFLFLRLQQIDFDSLNRGSTQPLLTQSDLKSQKLVQPSTAVLDYFSRVAQGLYARIDQSEVESRTLAALRDALLPKLISGELRVRDAEKFIERDI